MIDHLLLLELKLNYVLNFKKTQILPDKLKIQKLQQFQKFKIFRLKWTSREFLCGFLRSQLIKK